MGFAFESLRQRSGPYITVFIWVAFEGLRQRSLFTVVEALETTVVDISVGHR